MKIDIEKHYKLIFGSIYPLYVAKVERKGKTKEELDVVISWLTGYDQKAIQHRIDGEDIKELGGAHWVVSALAY